MDDSRPCRGGTLRGCSPRNGIWGGARLVRPVRHHLTCGDSELCLCARGDATCGCVVSERTLTRGCVCRPLARPGNECGHTHLPAPSVWCQGSSARCAQCRRAFLVPRS